MDNINNFININGLENSIVRQLLRGSNNCEITASIFVNIGKQICYAAVVKLV